MKEMLRESEEDIKNGNIMTIEESIERMKKNMKVSISDRAYRF